MSNSKPIYCIKSTEISNHTRRCFITGEYCSQQTNIQKQRKVLRDKFENENFAPEINAFVIMNFSSIADITYDTLIKNFIKGLSKYLYIDKNSNSIACVSSGDINEIIDDIENYKEFARNKPDDFCEKLAAVFEKDSSTLKNVLYDDNNKLNDGVLEELINKLEYKKDDLYKQLFNYDWNPVSKINVHRADSNPVSNYIICNRICQQIQNADLVIVDVTTESANVFYEFGLATSLNKLILPICFSDSYYKMVLPEKLNKAMLQIQENIAQENIAQENAERTLYDYHVKKLEKHIDCFPWRRKLFEYFGIRKQSATKTYSDDPSDEKKGISYLCYDEVVKEEYGFSDIKYNRFPYNDEIDGKSVGEQIYKWLQYNYHLKNKCDNIINDCFQHSYYNTLIVYTMSHVEDIDQAGRCIVTFYKNITKPMREKCCFCGDRIAILGQSNKVWDDPKDNKSGLGQPYKVNDFIYLGMNQASYKAEQKRIKTKDYLTSFENGCNFDYKTQVEGHVRYRCFKLNPDNPIYVSYLRDGIQKTSYNLIKKNGDNSFKCLYHLMLETLRYVSEIVIDLSSNSVQSLFWLGAAHGSDIYAVTVRHEMTEHEVNWSGNQQNVKDRSIFDINGLWTAIFRRNETNSFFKQLELIQLGIDQHTRIKLPEIDLEQYEENTLNQLYNTASVFSDLDKINEKKCLYGIESIFFEKNKAEKKALESYYRNRFWRQMHRDNQLHLLLHFNSNINKWDLDTVAQLSQYISKRKVISKFQIDTLGNSKDDSKIRLKSNSENLIVIGSQPKPFKYKTNAKILPCSLSKYISKEKDIKVFSYIKRNVNVRKNFDDSNEVEKDCYVEKREFSNGLFSYSTIFYQKDCFKCGNLKKCENEYLNIKTKKGYSITERKEVGGSNVHYPLLGQLLLWREKQDKLIDGQISYKYQVSLCGSSGPATKSLVALLVDDEQKNQILALQSTKDDNDSIDFLNRHYPLSVLQEVIREKFLKNFCDKLERRDITYDLDYLEIIKELSVCYLSTVLFHYFLPFLSYSDEKRIYNGLEAFLLMTKRDTIKKFEEVKLKKQLNNDVDEIFNNLSSFILNDIKTSLYNFRGVDALYEVSIVVSNNSYIKRKSDNREITNIRLLKDENSKYVVECLFIDGEGDD